MDQIKIGKFIAEERKAKKYTQRELADKLSISDKTISKWERGGSHPHMIHEFVRAIIEDRKPVVDDIVGAYWTGTGICAHQSAMEGGTVVKVPEFKKYL